VDGAEAVSGREDGKAGGREDRAFLSRIGQLALPAADLARAVAFYRDVLGVPFLFQAPPGLAFFDCAGIRLMLTAGEVAPKPHGDMVIYFRVDDIESAHRRLASGGVVFVDLPHLIARMPDHELWMCFFRDTEGNMLALMEERGRAVGR
jgi:methylmalonyl-CoA/ethylmalonyl-CoA epimerase